MKTLPWMMIGIAVILLSRKSVIELGLLLLAGSIAYLWLAAKVRNALHKDAS